MKRELDVLVDRAFPENDLYRSDGPLRKIKVLSDYWQQQRNEPDSSTGNVSAPAPPVAGSPQVNVVRPTPSPQRPAPVIRRSSPLDAVRPTSPIRVPDQPVALPSTSSTPQSAPAATAGPASRQPNQAVPQLELISQPAVGEALSETSAELPSTSGNTGWSSSLVRVDQSSKSNDQNASRMALVQKAAPAPVATSDASTSSLSDSKGQYSKFKRSLRRRRTYKQPSLSDQEATAKEIKRMAVAGEPLRLTSDQLKPFSIKTPKIPCISVVPIDIPPPVVSLSPSAATESPVKSTGSATPFKSRKSLLKAKIPTRNVPESQPVEPQQPSTSSDVPSDNLVRKLGVFTQQTDQNILTKVLGDPLANALEAIDNVGEPDKVVESFFSNESNVNNFLEALGTIDESAFDFGHRALDDMEVATPPHDGFISDDLPIMLSPPRSSPSSQLRVPSRMSLPIDEETMEVLPKASEQLTEPLNEEGQSSKPVDSPECQSNRTSKDSLPVERSEQSSKHIDESTENEITQKPIQTFSETAQKESASPSSESVDRTLKDPLQPECVNSQSKDDTDSIKNSADKPSETKKVSTQKVSTQKVPTQKRRRKIADISHVGQPVTFGPPLVSDPNGEPVTNQMVRRDKRRVKRKLEIEFAELVDSQKKSDKPPEKVTKPKTVETFESLVLKAKSVSNLRVAVAALSDSDAKNLKLLNHLPSATTNPSITSMAKEIAISCLFSATVDDKSVLGEKEHSEIDSTGDTLDEPMTDAPLTDVTKSSTKEQQYERLTFKTPIKVPPQHPAFKTPNKRIQTPSKASPILTPTKPSTPPNQQTLCKGSQDFHTDSPFSHHPNT